MVCGASMGPNSFQQGVDLMTNQRQNVQNAKNAADAKLAALKKKKVIH